MSGTQDPWLGGLLGNASLVSPTNPQGLLGIAAVQRVNPALAVAPSAPAAAPPAAPVAQQSALGAVQDWAQSMNRNAYGTTDPRTLGILGSAGYPLMSDPRLIQDRLAQMAQGTVQVPGVSEQDALDEFRRQLAVASNAGAEGSNPDAAAGRW